MKIDGKAIPEYVGRGQIYKTPSLSRPGINHYTIVGENGATCSCEGWQFTQHCWHIDNVPVYVPISRVHSVMVCGECKAEAKNAYATLLNDDRHHFMPCGHTAMIEYKDVVD